jgi:hypothetical protein
MVLNKRKIFINVMLLPVMPGEDSGAMTTSLGV